MDTLVELALRLLLIPLEILLELVVHQLFRWQVLLLVGLGIGVYFLLG